MIVKYIGGAILLIVGYMVGLSLYTMYIDRVKTIERIKEFILFCESEMTYTKTEFSAICEKFRQKPSKYDNYIFDSKRTLCIKPDSIHLLKSFTEKVGRIDSVSQKKLFTEVKGKLEEMLDTAKKDVSIKGKMLRRLAPIIAIGIFILTL